ncbi:MAG: ROK family protein [Candidatus Eremiobacteraeota bacterium]|nr:ROK family protein [Candidatus Eremiobacteraeota bacterium]MBC5804588.1 ROK family protein [Candidatus Eremiobacteraeota bacterium]MBC5822066.1 ROK family protein [Candidatus Eremiobacteraeota bacterium]
MDGYAVGVDLGGSHVTALLVEPNGRAVRRTSSLIYERHFEDVVNTMTGVIRELIGTMEICAGGVGSPGSIDPRDGVVRYSPNFGWFNAPLGTALRNRLNLPTYVANDARSATLGEYRYGSGHGTRDFALLTLGTGIGGGLVVAGQLVHGAAFAAGEIGHHAIRPTDGFICGCGNRGCFEAQASATGLRRHAFAASRIIPGQHDDIGRSVA